MADKTGPPEDPKDTEAKGPVKLGVFKAPAKKAPAKKAPAKRPPAKKVTRKKAPAKEPPTTPEFSSGPDASAPEEPSGEVLPFPAQLSVAEVDEASEKVFEGEVVDPVMTAYRARIIGHKPWHEVAKEAGYESASQAYDVVKTLLLNSIAEQRTERRMMAQMEAEHTYDAILAAHMPAAVGDARKGEKPDVNAAMVSLRARQAKDKIMRLGEVDQDIDTGRTIVIAGSPEEYVRGLQDVVGVVDAEVVEDGAPDQPRGDSTPG